MPLPFQSHPSGGWELLFCLEVPHLISQAIALKSWMKKSPVIVTKRRFDLICFSFSEGENQRGFWKSTLKSVQSPLFRYLCGETEALGCFWIRLSREVVTLLIVTPAMESCPTLCQVLKVCRHSFNLQSMHMVGMMICILHMKKLGFREVNNLSEVALPLAGRLQSLESTPALSGFETCRNHSSPVFPCCGPFPVTTVIIPTLPFLLRLLLRLDSGLIICQTTIMMILIIIVDVSVQPTLLLCPQYQEQCLAHQRADNFC